MNHTEKKGIPKWKKKEREGERKEHPCYLEQFYPPNKYVIGMSEEYRKQERKKKNFEEIMVK